MRSIKKLDDYCHLRNKVLVTLKLRPLSKTISYIDNSDDYYVGNIPK